MTDYQTDDHEPIEGALRKMLDDFVKADDWAAELAAEHAESLARLARIRRSFRDLTNMLPREKRMEHLRNLAAILPSRTRYERTRTQLSGELEAFFRIHRGEPFTAGEVHEWLTDARIDFPRERLGSELSRRAREGQLRRLGRGRYEVVLTIREQLGR